MTLRALQRFCGTAVSTFPAVPDAQFRLQSLYACFALGPRRGMRQLSSRALTDLESWCCLATSPDVGRALWHLPVRGEITTGACPYGWGGLLGRLVPARGFFSSADQTMHINVQEMLAMLYSLRSFQHLRGPGVIRFRIDSMFNVHVRSSMRSRSPALMDVVRDLHFELNKRQLSAEAYWLSTVANKHAARLSRDRDGTDWRLRRSPFLVLHSRWGAFTVDRFATAVNTQLERFNSAVANPGFHAVDAYLQPWGGLEHNYINPPLSQAALVISEIAQDNASAVFVLPVWPAQPWWARILSLATKAVVLSMTAPLYAVGPGSCSAATLANGRVLCPTQEDFDHGLRWRAAVDVGILATLAASSAGAAFARMILRKDITAGTAHAYDRRWAAFENFCEENNWVALPATPGAVACYFGTLAERDLEPSTIRGYLTPLNNRHMAAGFPKQAVGPLLTRLREGCARL